MHETKGGVMSKAKCLFIVFLLILLSSAQTECMAFGMSGNDLVSLMREYDKADRDDRSTDYSAAREYRGFVIGVRDSTRFLYDMPDGVTQGQIGAIVSKYLKAHPEEWSAPAAFLVINALKEAFPLKEEKKKKR